MASEFYELDKKRNKELEKEAEKGTKPGKAKKSKE